MCVAALGAVVSAIGAVAGYAGQVQQTNAYNEAAAQNAVNASLAAQRKYEDEGRSLVYDTKRNMQEGYDAEMKARQARGTAIASAGGSGLDISGITVGAILSDINQQNAINQGNVSAKQDDMIAGTKSRNRSYEAEAQGRINSMPFKATPSPLGLAINLAGIGAEYYKDTRPA
jgi:uncharacterized membrane protein